MPVPVIRDAAATRAALQRWFTERVAGGDGIQVLADLEVPQGAGNANETILFTAARTADGTEHVERYVLRIAAQDYILFMDASLESQVRLVRALREHTVLPAPDIRWYEPDDGFLGAPFCVMARAPGRVPPDRAAVANWTLELSLEQRRRLWENGFDALCSIHTTSGRAPAEALLAEGLHGRTGVQAELDHWGRYRSWAGLHDQRLDDLHDWLTGHVPTTSTTGLSWGDARPENMVFDDDLRCTAILDWEMAGLGGPLMDLGWWLMSDRFAAVARTRPPGYADRTETLERWVRRTGVAVDDLPWYEVFSAYRLGAICARIVGLNAARGIDLSGHDLVGNALRLADEIVTARTN